MPLETGQGRANEVKHVKLLLISDLPYVSKLCGIRSFDSPQLIVWLLLAEVYSAWSASASSTLPLDSHSDTQEIMRFEAQSYMGIAN